MNVLKKTDQYQNTVLLFLSDNGAKFDKKEEGKKLLQTYLILLIFFLRFLTQIFGLFFGQFSLFEIKKSKNLYKILQCFDQTLIIH